MLQGYREIDSRVRIYHQENKGLVASLNRGCQLARGKYIARMDADDVAIKDRLARQVDFMESHEEVAVVGGAVEVINARGECLAKYRNPPTDKEIKAALLQGGCPLWHPAVIMRTRTFLAVGGYRKVVVDAEDLDLWLRIADHHQLANIDAVVLKYRRHDGQVSVRKLKQQALSNLAARIATLSRRVGNPDPLDSVAELTPEVLGKLGASKRRLEANLAKRYLVCIRNMSEVCEYTTARNLVCEVYRSHVWVAAENPVRADLCLVAARLHWLEGEIMKSVVFVGRALITWPILVGRPLKPALRYVRRKAEFNYQNLVRSWALWSGWF
jgi:glycosyltransferase involved in cell wall biosynthesis